MTIQQKLNLLANNGISTSIVYGPCGAKGALFSVDVLTAEYKSFERPFAATTLQQAVDIALLECKKRGWISKK